MTTEQLISFIAELILLVLPYGFQKPTALPNIVSVISVASAPIDNARAGLLSTLFVLLSHNNCKI